MAWQLRGSSRVYYRSRRVGEEVRRIFVGRGTAGEMAEHVDRCLRRERLRLEEERQQRTKVLKHLLALQVRLEKQRLVLIRAHIIVAGFYQHHRSEWRRRRMPSRNTTSRKTIPFPATVETGGKWNELVEKANGGDAAALAQVRTMLRQQPEFVVGAELEVICRDQALDLICANHAVLREALILKIDALEADLAGEKPLPAVRLAAKRAALAWLTLQVADLHCAEQLKRGAVPKGWLGYRDNTEQRYLLALKFLETIRSLGRSESRK